MREYADFNADSVNHQEHERLVAMKHRLEAGSWREMIMKLCDIYEETIKVNQTPKQETKPEPKEASVKFVFPFGKGR